jgi:hypothetical protein
VLEDRAGDKRRDRTAADLDEQPIEAIESIVELFEASVQLVELFVDPVEAGVNAGELLIDLVEFMSTPSNFFSTASPSCRSARSSLT